MKLSIAALFIVGANAFAPASTSRKAVTQLNGMANDVGIPCEDECAMESFPNLPPSVHPGVLSGQAMMDLLDHAKQNGEFRRDWWPRLDWKPRPGKLEFVSLQLRKIRNCRSWDDVSQTCSDSWPNILMRKEGCWYSCSLPKVDLLALLSSFTARHSQESFLDLLRFKISHTTDARLRLCYPSC